MASQLLPNMWTLVARFTAPAGSWMESLDIASNEASNWTIPTPAEGICTSFVDWMTTTHRGASTRLSIFQIYPKRVGKGPLASGFYEPLSEVALNQACTGDAVWSNPAGDMLDLQVVGYVRKHAAGRDGKVFHRLMMREGDVTTTQDGGFWTFADQTAQHVNPASYQTRLTDSGLSEYFTDAPATGVHYVAIAHVHMVDDQPQTSIHPVTAMTLEYPGLRERRRPR